MYKPAKPHFCTVSSLNTNILAISQKKALKSNILKNKRRIMFKALIFILSAVFSYFQRDRKFSQGRFSSVLLSAETLRRRKSGLLLLIPTASFQPPPLHSPLWASGRTYLPHTPASPLSRAGLGKYQPFRGSVFVEGWSEATCREARLLSHCSAALSERSGVPPSMLDWA